MAERRRQSHTPERVATPIPHDSAHKHVTGEAVYTDDIACPTGTLFAAIGVSQRPHARVTALDLEPVWAMPGVVDVVAAQDIPGRNDIGPVIADEPVFASDLVEYVGQPLFAVAATDVELARRAARAARVSYDDLPPILTIDEALAHQSYVSPSTTMTRGSPEATIPTAPHRLQGHISMGGQDHFYLEGQIALAVPQEDGDLLVFSSTQHPSEVQEAVSHVLARPANAVTVEVRRLGGGFGGKETQASLFACIAALLSDRTRQPVKLRVDRDDDMIITGKRHDFTVTYDVGFANDGRIMGLELTLASRCGRSADLSGAVNDRAVFHSDNAYYLEHVSITSHRCKTHTVSNTAFRGFGGPQGMMGIEAVIDEIARHLGLDAVDVRHVNLYGEGERNVTPYGMQIEDNVLPSLVTRLEISSDYRSRRRDIAAFNASSPVLKRGLALTPVKFGISFTLTHLNQAGALVHVYTDGSVHLNHGGTEMGQGLFVKVAQIVAEELQIDLDRIKVTATNTGKVPNTSATAASASTDLNGRAAQIAARTIRERLVEFAAAHFGVSSKQVEFGPDGVRVGDERFSFAQLAKRAHRARVPLSATGYYRTPKIHYDRERGQGRPFYYFAYGAAVSEVLIDSLTGEYRVLRVDILHDAGRSINPAIDRGQIEGGFVQGMGWLTTEELYWDADGTLRTHAPSTYKIPVCSDVPVDFRVSLLEGTRNREDVVHGSKAVGEPPLMLAISVFHALRDAISAFGPGLRVHLDAPATPERVLLAIDDLQRRRAQPIAAPAAGPVGTRGETKRSKTVSGT